MTDQERHMQTQSRFRELLFDGLCFASAIELVLAEAREGRLVTTLSALSGTPDCSEAV